MIRAPQLCLILALACATGLAGGGAARTSGAASSPGTLEGATSAPALRPAAAFAQAGEAQKSGSGLSYQLSLLAGAAESAQAAGHSLDIGDAAGLRALADARQLRLDEAGMVQVYISLEGDAPAAQQTIARAGARIERADRGAGLVQALVPATGLRAIAALAGVRAVRLPDYAVLQTGSIESEGDAVLGASDLRGYLPSIDGASIAVGVISDGVAGLAESQGSGDLGPVDTITCNTFGGDPEEHGAEGTAMLEIVHDIAPGARLVFGNFGFGTGLDFNAAVNCLAGSVDIIVDDVGFYGAGPYDGTSYISANTAAALNSSGPIRAYYTAAGNQAGRHYQGPFVSSGFTISAGGDTWSTQRFEATNAPHATVDAGLVPAPASFNRFRLAAGASATITLAWNDVWGGSGNDYDLFFGTAGSIFACSLNDQNGSQDPVESCTVANDSPSTQDVDIYIANYRAGAAPRMLDLFLLCTRCSAFPNGHHLDFDTPGSSVGNQADAGGSPAPVMAIGAVRYSSPGEIEDFSSQGPTESARTKPDLVGPDGVCVTGHGGFSPTTGPCQDSGQRFFGTSAAAPHIAGIAALLLQCTPSLTRLTLRDRLISASADLGDFGPDNLFGYGRPDVFAAALAADTCGLPTPTPTATPTDTSTPTVTPTPGTPTTTPTPTGTPTPSPTPPLLFGDVNCDGAVNPIDAALILQHSAGLLAGFLCPQNADANHDGRVDPIDAALVLQVSAGLLTQIP